MTETARFPCAQCGGALRYSPGADRLTCAFCGHENFVETPEEARHALRELDFRRALNDQLWREEQEETRVFTCNECGASIEFDGAVHAAECPYCAEPVVADTGAHRHFKPRGVVPFRVTEKQARAALRDWLGRLWFAPSQLRQYAHDEGRMTGVYTPYWTFDAQTESTYSGQRGDVYYVTQRVTVMTKDGPRETTQQVPQIRWTPVRGRVRRFFDDVLVLASKALPPKFADRLGPWDLHALVPYTPAYLAGFRAEAYTIDLQNGFAEARGVMDMMIRRDVRFDIGGDQQRIDALDTNFGDITFKHVLLPIWIAAYRYRGKVYRFVVNGHSGAVTGERPYSGSKIVFAFILGALCAAAIGYGLYISGALDGNTAYVAPSRW